MQRTWEKGFQDWTLRYEHPLVRTRTVLSMGAKVRRHPHPGWSIKHSSSNGKGVQQLALDAEKVRLSDDDSGQNVGIPWCSSRGVILSADQQVRGRTPVGQRLKMAKARPSQACSLTKPRVGKDLEKTRAEETGRNWARAYPPLWVNKAACGTCWVIAYWLKG